MPARVLRLVKYERWLYFITTHSGQLIWSHQIKNMLPKKNINPFMISPLDPCQRSDVGEGMRGEEGVRSRNSKYKDLICLGKCEAFSMMIEPSYFPSAGKKYLTLTIYRRRGFFLVTVSVQGQLTPR